MLKIVSEKGNWNIIIDGIEYDFYYSDVKPIEGLTLNGCNTQEQEYQIGNHIITATKEGYPYSDKKYRYILNVETI